MIDAQWLFENHLSHLALEKYLLARIEHIIRPNDLRNAEDISGQTLKRPPLGMPPQKNYQGSSTERIALLLQETEMDQPKETITEYEKQLYFCRFLIELYDAVLVSLTPREAWLVDAIYHQGMTMSSIQNEPGSPFDSCNRSTVYRSRKRIIHKANYFIQAYIPKEVSPCHLEKFMNELKRFQERSTMS